MSPKNVSKQGGRDGGIPEQTWNFCGITVPVLYQAKCYLECGSQASNILTVNWSVNWKDAWEGTQATPEFYLWMGMASDSSPFLLANSPLRNYRQPWRCSATSKPAATPLMALTGSLVMPKIMLTAPATINHATKACSGIPTWINSRLPGLTKGTLVTHKSWKGGWTLGQDPKAGFVTSAVNII